MTKNLFDEAAARWDDNPHRVRLMGTIGETILREAAPTPRDAVLDYGCGTGLVGLYLLPHVGEVTGADNSQGMLDVLKGKIAEGRLAGMHTMRLDLEHESPPGGRQWDLITVGMAMHHIADVDKVLGAFRRMLSPGGRLCVADLDTEPGTFHGGAMGEKVPHNGFDREEMKRRLIALGFAEARDTTVVTFAKPVEGGGEQEFSIFLITATV
ncbi:MAG: methyltransferase domain-containing protein [Planctomycetes bacterium]|nr:methyltransferase domain-containing protein [Planctomycetota bacterium]